MRVISGVYRDYIETLGSGLFKGAGSGVLGLWVVGVSVNGR